MRLVTIPKYNEYRLDVIFDAYKWDPQFSDNNTIAKYALVITESEAAELNALTEKLGSETVAAENMINNNLQLSKPLALPRKIKKLLKNMSEYNPDNNIRLMRFDFHPIVGGGYAVSEVNSDVPGGFAEASLMPQVAIKYLDKDNFYNINFGELLINQIKKKIKSGGTVAFVHCTSYSDDRQVMQFLGDNLEKSGYRIIYLAADHLKFENGKAFSILESKNFELDAIVRFTPIEWVKDIKSKNWHGYFDTTTISCNHSIAVYAQTKRFGIIFDRLENAGVDLSAWRKLLPETLDVKNAKGREGFIYKPACGRVGEGISIKDACLEDEYKKILKDVKRHPKAYVSQKMFDSLPITSDEGEEFHVCLGAYSIEGKASGFYSRISKSRRIDSGAADIPVIIQRSDK